MTTPEHEDSIVTIAAALKAALGFRQRRPVSFGLLCWILEWYVNARDEGVGIYAVPLDAIGNPFVRGEGVELRRLGTIALSLGACPYKVVRDYSNVRHLICPTEAYVIHRTLADKGHARVCQLARHAADQRRMKDAWGDISYHEREADRLQSMSIFRHCSGWLADRFALCASEDDNFVPSVVTAPT